MSTGVTEVQVAASPPRPRRGRWLAVIAVAFLSAAYLAAIFSTHAALSGGFVGWSGAVPGHSAGLGPITSAEREQTDPSLPSSQVFWASRPGGEVTFGLQVHNGGPVPVTLLGIALLGIGAGHM